MSGPCACAWDGLLRRYEERKALGLVAGEALQFSRDFLAVFEELSPVDRVRCLVDFLATTPTSQRLSNCLEQNPHAADDLLSEALTEALEQCDPNELEVMATTRPPPSTAEQRARDPFNGGPVQ